MEYPYKKKEGGILKNEGLYHIPKNEIVDDHMFSLTRKEFMIISESIFKKVLERLLKGEKIKLPSKLGFLELKKYKPKNKSVDWKETNRLYSEHNKENPKNKKFIFHKNYHSNGYKPILKWEKNSAIFINKKIFGIKFTRDVDRLIASHFKNNPSEINNLNTL